MAFLRKCRRGYYVVSGSWAMESAGGRVGSRRFRHNSADEPAHAAVFECDPSGPG
jgi:hypothetical protein